MLSGETGFEVAHTVLCFQFHPLRLCRETLNFFLLILLLFLALFFITLQPTDLRGSRSWRGRRGEWIDVGLWYEHDALPIFRGYIAPPSFITVTVLPDEKGNQGGSVQ